MSGDGARNVLMFLGSMMVVCSFWLVVLGFANGSAMQLMGAAVTVAIAVFCFRAYFASLRRDRGK